ncbi:MAG: ATP-binding protein [Pirellulales bacterium]|nr:ATP-binding protein [Pirellulales bacterium]
MAGQVNPFRPGAGHIPPYLAGRKGESEEFRRLLKQDVVLENMVITGLRGVGKTVLLDTFRPEAIQSGWAWAGDNISESSSSSEERLAIRLMTDLAVITSTIVIGEKEFLGIGYRPEKQLVEQTFDYDLMWSLFQSTPGLVADKLKKVLESAWRCIQCTRRRGLVFAYDEAQNLSDNPSCNEYPLSLLLDVFQSIQKKGIPILLILAGLPTLFPNLVGARTYAERMFRVVFLDHLNDTDTRDAILVPLREFPVFYRTVFGVFVPEIIRMSGGYPYFIQFICRELYDVQPQVHDADGQQEVDFGFPVPDVIRKLDADFYAGRWARTTDRQRELLSVIAHLDSADEEFTVREIVIKSKTLLPKPFRPSHVNQMLSTLANAGIVYKNRHGKYSFAVPLLRQFILRQQHA